MNWLFNVTINDISVIYVTAHSACGLKKELDKVVIMNISITFYSRILQRARPSTDTGHPLYTVIPRNRPIKSPFTTRWGYRGHIPDLIPGSPRGLNIFKGNYLKTV